MSNQMDQPQIPEDSGSERKLSPETGALNNQETTLYDDSEIILAKEMDLDMDVTTQELVVNDVEEHFLLDDIAMEIDVESSVSETPIFTTPVVPDSNKRDDKFGKVRSPTTRKRVSDKPPIQIEEDTQYWKRLAFEAANEANDLRIRMAAMQKSSNPAETQVIEQLASTMEATVQLQPLPTSGSQAQVLVNRGTINTLNDIPQLVADKFNAISSSNAPADPAFDPYGRNPGSTGSNVNPAVPRQPRVEYPLGFMNPQDLEDMRSTSWAEQVQRDGVYGLTKTKPTISFKPNDRSCQLSKSPSPAVQPPPPVSTHPVVNVIPPALPNQVVNVIPPTGCSGSERLCCPSGPSAVPNQDVSVAPQAAHLPPPPSQVRRDVDNSPKSAVKPDAKTFPRRQNRFRERAVNQRPIGEARGEIPPLGHQCKICGNFGHQGTKCDIRSHRVRALLLQVRGACRLCGCKHVNRPCQKNKPCYYCGAYLCHWDGICPHKFPHTSDDDESLWNIAEKYELDVNEIQFSWGFGRRPAPEYPQEHVQYRNDRSISPARCPPRGTVTGRPFRRDDRSHSPPPRGHFDYYRRERSISPGRRNDSDYDDYDYNYDNHTNNNRNYDDRKYRPNNRRGNYRSGRR